MDALREHHETGLLDAEEFTERVEAAMRARYLDELPPLLEDLPAPPREEPTVRERRTSRTRALPVPLPLLLLLAAFAVVIGVTAAATARFPWPLLWLGLAFHWCKPGRCGARRGSRA